MTDQQDNGQEPEQRTAFDLAYHGQSAADGAQFNLFANAKRSPVGFAGKLKDPLQFREFFSALYEVVKSDMRYQPKDRSAYLAFKQQSGRGGIKKSAFAAQKEYFQWLRDNDPLAWLILDPIVTAHPDKLIFEVFSKDEGSYMRLDVKWEAFDLDGDPRFGTTNVDFSDALFESLQSVRDGCETQIAMTSEAFGLKTDTAETIEKRVSVPTSWLHGFLQVQSAAMLADEIAFELAPMDLYNLLRHLRLNADQKGKGRSIRAELTPGENPRLVLEPWELVLEVDAPNYKGKDAQVVRIWGRRRLFALSRILPFVDSVKVHLIGNGMPGFWVFECGPFTVTLGMTGYVASNWSQTVHLDVMLPAGEADDETYNKVIAALKEKYVSDLKTLQEQTGLSKKDCTAALQRGCKQGDVIYDLASGAYRFRQLREEGLDLDALRFRNNREREAFDLVQGHGGSLKLTGENEVVGRGTEYSAQVDVKADLREYETKFLLTPDGRVYRPDCTCTFFRKHQLKEGPCPHLLALRMVVAKTQVERSRQSPKKLTGETRTYVRRHEKGEDVYTLSFDKKQLKVRWGLRSDRERRFQRLMFNDIDEARTAYLARIADLKAKGFMDATE